MISYVCFFFSSRRRHTRSLCDWSSDVCSSDLDISKGEGELIRIGQINLPAIVNTRRAQRKLPSVDARALDGNWKKQVGVIEIIVVEEIHGAGEEIAGVQCPAMERNGDAKLVLFIAFTVERNEAQVLIAGGLQERTGNRKQRRRLVEMPVKSVKNPVQFGNPQRCTEAQTGGILNRAPGKVRLAKAGIKREPRCCFELLLPVDRRERSIRAMSFGIDVLALRRVVTEQAKKLAVLLREAVKAKAK